MAVLTDIAPDGTGLDSAAPDSAEKDDSGGAAPAAALQDASDAVEPVDRPSRANGRRLALAYGVLPALVILLAMAAGLLKFWDGSARSSEVARIDSVQAAKDSTIAMLSYQPDSVEADLAAAQDLLTGDFRDAYIELTNDVVIPGAREKRISTVASVPGAASVTATSNHAVVLVFVNQSAIVGSDAPTDTASSIRVTLDKVDGRWLISGFDPI
ncbi:hypothetical protein [[Mycobacterium] nativiensis]|uniref:Mce associated membrane protein n=1 Tax=[Mycobacterium] nativiensis TaxID=2855503 RepID=A0ABU5XZU0_9MYCO|nr:hypothetical protein [Mycolicibacter sp. MYC340]MEB3032946.1 hypothetical protein [Mycolicibacter sp. MYC340]